MLEIMQYVRKPFPVQAVRVGPENINDIVDWCKGKLDVDQGGAQYIQVDAVRNPITPRQSKAYLGDWVLLTGTSFKVYTDKAFKKSFEQSSVETIMQPTKPEVQVVPAVVVQEVVVPTASAPKPGPAVFQPPTIPVQPTP